MIEAEADAWQLRESTRLHEQHAHGFTGQPERAGVATAEGRTPWATQGGCGDKHDIRSAA